MHNVPEINVIELADALERGEAIHLLDVRQPEEHAVAALPHSQLIPLGQLPSRHAEIRPSPGATIVTYCHHGIRSLQAAAYLRQCGYDRVASLRGGIDAWSIYVDPSVRRY